MTDEPPPRPRMGRPEVWIIVALLIIAALSGIYAARVLMF